MRAVLQARAPIDQFHVRLGWFQGPAPTTGLPKAIVHGHGGNLLEHLKTHVFHLDTRPGDLWFTTTAWAMWNIIISGLLRRIISGLLRRPCWCREP